MKSLRFLLVFSLLAGLFLSSIQAAFAFDKGTDPCGYVAGVSALTIDLVPDAGRTDFDLGEWDLPASPYTDYPPVSYATISDNDKLCFDKKGNQYGDNRYAWNANIGWIDFGWCNASNPAVYPACIGLGPEVDFPLTSDMAYTGDAYWSGYAWSDNIGWIWFDWDCPLCTLTERVRAQLPAEYPGIGADEWANIRGYAWNDSLGWMKFGNPSLGNDNVVQDLPGDLPIVYVQPIVTLTPDPNNVTKYGIGGDQAPLADWDDSYELSVRLLIVGGAGTIGENLTDGYAVNLALNKTADSYVYTDQLNRTGDDAVGIDYDTAPLVTAKVVDPDPLTDEFVFNIKSLAPTSNMNGYDKDGDGDLEYYFDWDPSDLTGGTKSSIANQWLIESIDISIEEDPMESEFYTAEAVIEDAGAGTYPLWDLSISPIDLKFAPAVEVASLAREVDETLWDTTLSTTINDLQSIRGLAVVRSSQLLGQNFGISYTLGSDNYYFLFDADDDGDFVPVDTDPLSQDTDDISSSTHNISVVGTADDLLPWSLFADYIPVEALVDYFEPISYGNPDGNLVGEVMLVNSGGYTAYGGAVRESMIASASRDFPSFAELILESFSSPPVAHAVGGIDLTITDLYLDTTFHVVAVHENIGTLDITDDSGISSITEDGGYAGSYVYSVLDSSFTWDGFFNAGGMGAPSAPSPLNGQHTVEVCADATDAYNELDELNNCRTEVLGGPDLTISNIYRDINSDLYITMENIGNEDVVDTSGYTKIWIDGLETSLLWSDLVDQSFLNSQGSTDFKVQAALVGDHNVEACIDTSDVVNNESDETNNCKSVVFGAGITIGPGYVTKVKYGINVGGATQNIAYYSNYLPHQSGEGYYSNVPAYDYKLDIEIGGSITSLTGEETVGDSGVQVLGNVTTIQIRNGLFQRFSQLSKGVTITDAGDVFDYNFNNIVTTDMGALVAENENFGNYGVTVSDDILYFEGDTVVQGIGDTYDQKTIVVVGGDLYIDDNFTGSSSVGFVVFRDTSLDGGYVYINSEVTDLKNVNLYADNSVLRYDPAVGVDVGTHLPNWADLDERQQYLDNQFYWGGSVISQNTIYGMDADPMLLPNGSTTIDEDEAREYDLNHLSEFVLCWVATDTFYNPLDQDGDGSYEDANYDTLWDEGDMEECYATIDPVRSGNLITPVDETESGLGEADNMPVYFEYIPPPSDLPLLGGTSASSVSIF